ncbi:MAG: hypothetical protein RLZZ535_835 [Cyanobacteriota bacterium]|jgi:hypothetical protein
MLKIEQVVKQDRLLRALTELNKKAFESLVATFEQQYQQSLQSADRKRTTKSPPKIMRRKMFDSDRYLRNFKCQDT